MLPRELKKIIDWTEPTNLSYCEVTEVCSKQFSDNRNNTFTLTIFLSETSTIISNKSASNLQGLIILESYELDAKPIQAGSYIELCRPQTTDLLNDQVPDAAITIFRSPEHIFSVH